MTLRHREYLGEARSENLGDGKWEYKGKKGVWRTLGNYDRAFFPDDGSGPMAMRKHGKKKSLVGKAKGFLKKAVGSLKKKMGKKGDDFEMQRASGKKVFKIKQR